jgi:hypothetical protein
VKIEYHTSFPNSDAINGDNPADHNARAAFYGITTTTVPYAFIDGQASPVNTKSFTGSNWWNNFISKRSLVSSLLRIDIATAASTSANELSIDASVTALDDIIDPTLKPRAFVAVLEKQVGTNQFVLRKFLPNAAGKSLTLPVASGETRSIITPAEPWIAGGISNPSQIAIAVFVQDELTKEVYQAAVLMNPNPAHLPTQVTNTEDPAYAQKVVVYPNPADGELTIVLPDVPQQAVPVRLIDNVGKVASTSAIKAGRSSETLNTRELAAGVYLLELQTKNGPIKRKVIIAH